jgi:hypothetical protein
VWMLHIAAALRCLNTHEKRNTWDERSHPGRHRRVGRTRKSLNDSSALRCPLAAASRQDGSNALNHARERTLAVGQDRPMKAPGRARRMCTLPARRASRTAHRGRPARIRVTRGRRAVHGAHGAQA